VRNSTLLLAPELFASEGGIPRILQSYLRALSELSGPDRRISLLALNDTMLDSRDLRRCDPASRVHDWRMCSRSKYHFVRTALSMSRHCDRIVCGHVAQLPVALLAKVFNPDLSYYLVAHGIEVWRRFTLAEKLALRGAHRILCVSDFTRREMAKHISLPPEKYAVLYNALESEPSRDPVPPPSSPPVILTIARLSAAERYKGVDHLIQAMPAIRAARPDVVLKVVGRGDDLGRMQTLVRKLELGRSVELMGYVDDKRLRQELSACTLFALPSEKEGFGLVYLEAMNAGRPCLAARAGGAPEVISVDSGLLVDYGDVNGIAERCLAALNRTWDPEAIRAHAARFSYSQFRERLGSLLNG